MQAMFADIPLLSAVAEAVAVRAATVQAQQTVTSAPAAQCTRCNGSGRFIGRTGRELGDCFACKGTGKGPAPRAAVEGKAVTDEALRAAFDRARASGLIRLRLNLGGLVVKPAKATGRNAGALYVTEGGTYLGKVAGGQFIREACCGEEQATKVAALLSDPQAAIEATGRETGRCCLCGLTLTDPESVSAGIGPVCRQKWGF